MGEAESATSPGWDQGREDLELVLRVSFDAVDEASTRGTLEEGFDVGRTDPVVGDDVGLINRQRGIFPVDHRHLLGYGEPDIP